MKRPLVMAMAATAIVAAAGYGFLQMAPRHGSVTPAQSANVKVSGASDGLTPTVTVAPAVHASFVDNVLVTGSLVARSEVLIAPEVEGLRITELKAEEGDTVRKGQVLARLEQETLESQLAQNSASLARSAAAIAQAHSQISQADARLAEAAANFERARPLRKSGAVSEAVYEQREAAARTASAQLAAARDGLKVAEAERAQIEAQRRELTWRRSRTEILAPIDGLISRRSARVGGMATAIGEPMFRMAAAGEIELDAEVPEMDMERLKVGQPARITVPGAGDIAGTVRLVSPEVDRTTRLGKARIFLGSDGRLRIGSFGRGLVAVGDAQGLSVPAAAVMFTHDGPQVLVVTGDNVAMRRVAVGLVAGDKAEITSGITEGELVVAKAGTFLRDGDRVRPIRVPPEKISEVN